MLPYSTYAYDLFTHAHSIFFHTFSPCSLHYVLFFLSRFETKLAKTELVYKTTKTAVYLFHMQNIYIQLNDWIFKLVNCKTNVGRHSNSKSFILPWSIECSFSWYFIMEKVKMHVNNFTVYRNKQNLL